MSNSRNTASRDRGSHALAPAPRHLVWGGGGRARRSFVPYPEHGGDPWLRSAAPHLLRSIALWVLLITPWLGVSAAYGAAPADVASIGGAEGAGDVASFDLSELMNMAVVAVSKREQQQKDVAASIYVLTADDIRRAAVTRWQDLWNLLPGVWVVDLAYDDSEMAIRDRLEPMYGASQILVDDVPLVSILTGSMLFALQDFDFNSIDRVELIRGQAGTLYGVNAATGIIAIYTKRPSERQGVWACVEGGTRNYVAPSLSYGGRLGERTWVSAFAKGKLHAGFAKNPDFEGERVLAPLPDGSFIEVDNAFGLETGDQQIMTVGANLESQLSERLNLRAGARLAAGKGRHFFGNGAHWDPAEDEIWVSQQWRQDAVAHGSLDFDVAQGHRMRARASYLRAKSRFPIGTGMKSAVQQVALDVQYDLTLGEVHALTFGASTTGVHLDMPSAKPRNIIAFRADKDFLLKAGAFITFAVNPTPWLEVAAGVRAEIWTLSYVWPPELSPFMRASARAGSDLTLWSSVGRSNAAPSYVQTDMEFRSQEVFPQQWIGVVPGDGEVKPTVYQSYEGGIRYQPTRHLHLDASVFVTTVDNRVFISTLDFASKRPSIGDPNVTILPTFYENLREGTLWGGEVVVRAHPISSLRLEASYSLFRSKFRDLPGKASAFPDDEGTNPEHILRGRLYWDLPWELSFNAATIWVGRHATSFFNYRRQRSLFGTDGEAVDTGSGDARLRLSFKLEKKFLSSDVSVYAWGRDVLTASRVDHYSAWAFSRFPKTTHRTFGFGVDWQL